MGQVVVAGRVVAVVGGQQRCPDALGYFDQLRVGLALLFQAVVLKLNEEVVAPEYLLQPHGVGRGQLDVAP